MADDVDLATELAAGHLSRSIAQARQPIVTGEAGECDGCMEPMPRLVGGLCGYCRDRRPNPRVSARLTPEAGR